jgi:hypothetical protein
MQSLTELRRQIRALKKELEPLIEAGRRSARSRAPSAPISYLARV